MAQLEKESIDSDLEAMGVWAEFLFLRCSADRGSFLRLCRRLAIRSELPTFLQYLSALDLSERPSDNYPPNRRRARVRRRSGSKLW